MIRYRTWLTFSFLFIPLTWAEVSSRPAITAPIPVETLRDFQHYPPQVQHLIRQAAELSEKNLTYRYGSANPNNRGMDCSGTIYYLLKSVKVKAVPRASDTIYQWVRKTGDFHEVADTHFDSPQFNYLKPGDLLFWSGTYDIKRAIPITHFMVYLGKNKQGKPLMFGASNGRTYQGKSMWGVSVFDFLLPAKDSKAKFVGYSCIPELTCGIDKT